MRTDRGWLAMLLVICLLVPLEGAAREERMDDPQLQQRFRDLGSELRCPKCQNESIIESGAPISSDMRERVRQLLREGHSNEEIRDAMVARFGDFVRYRPAFEPRTWVLWLGPFVAIAVGIALVILLALRARRREQEGTNAEGALSEEERRRAEQWLRDGSE